MVLACVQVMLELSPTWPLLGADGRCVMDNHFFKVSSIVLGYYVVMTGASILTLLVQCALVAMYNVEGAYRYWKPNLFIFAVFCTSAVVFALVVIQVINAVVQGVANE
jgi:hypothetical protein